MPVSRWNKSIHWTEKMILRIVKARVCGLHRLDLTFNDGVRKRVSVKPLLKGPIFEPLLSPRKLFMGPQYQRGQERPGKNGRLETPEGKVSWPYLTSMDSECVDPR